MLFWIAFHVFILGMIFLDLKGFKKPVNGVFFWIAIALGFNAFIWNFLGKEQALTFFTAYLVETSLSIDNLFVFFTIFSFFNIKKVHQHKVLLLGVLGALLCRIIFILIGITLLNLFSWMYFAFGAILCVSAIYLWKSHGINIKDSFLFALAKRWLPIDEKEHDGRFFIRRRGKIYVTVLFLALLFIEATDVLFAVDSIPAVLAITKDPFLAYTSNVFAVLGLRSFYLVLAKLQDKLEGLKPAILCILLFIGVKMFISPFIHVSNFISLVVIVLILSVFLFFFRKNDKR
ncbi:MAG: TerC/Alx family metal homeostasis membrane protein [Verrucomicrobia bacterium]|nr:TerC/Alx family metal homeostasis membrane protein [Verrucomicrobiota bacterium]